MSVSRDGVMTLTDLQDLNWIELQHVSSQSSDMLKQSCVVYCVKNVLNDKLYVGKTSGRFIDRLNGHVYDALVNDSSYAFHAAIRKHGVSSFQATMLCQCCRLVDDQTLSPDKHQVDADQLKEREIHFIDALGSHVSRHGYNLTLGGEGLHGFKHSDASKKKMSAAKRGIPMPQHQRDALLKPVEQVDLASDEVVNVFSCVSEAVKITGILNVSWACRGRVPQAGGFKWRYVDQDDARRGSWSDDARVRMVNRLSRSNPLTKPVDQIDLGSGVVLKKHDSIKSAHEDTGITNISACVRGIRKSAGGYFWRYR